MLNKIAAGIVMTTALTASLAGATFASAQDEPAGRVTVLKTTTSPSTGVTPGTVVTAKATGAPKGQEFVCILSVVSQKDGKTLTASNMSSLKAAKANKKGVVTCKQSYNKWTAQDENGVARHCPPTKKDKKAGFRCGIALADKETIGFEYAGVGFFTPAS